MLPEGYRLPKQTLDLLFKQGKRVSCQNVRAIFFLNSLPNSRFLIILRTDKKQNSVKRHRSLRLIRIFLMNHKNMVTKPVDIAIIVSLTNNTAIDATLKNCSSIFEQINAADI